MQRLKWFIPMIAAMLFVAVVAPGTSEAGKKWSGADPMLTVNGERFNVRIEWPSEYDCDIRGDIHLKVFVQKGAAVDFHSESVGIFNGCEVTTKTQVMRALRGNNFGVETRLKASEDFPVKTKVDRNGYWIAEFVGSSNEVFRGVIDLDDTENETVDPALPIDYNGEEYVYDDDVYEQVMDLVDSATGSDHGWKFGFDGYERDSNIDDDDEDNSRWNRFMDRFDRDNDDDDGDRDRGSWGNGFFGRSDDDDNDRGRGFFDRGDDDDDDDRGRSRRGNRFGRFGRR